MPKMKQLGYSTYELSKMQNGRTVRELMLFPKQTQPASRPEWWEMIVARLGKLSSASNPLIRLGPWLMSPSATLVALTYLNLGGHPYSCPPYAENTRLPTRLERNLFLAPTLFPSASICIPYTIPIIALLAVHIYRLHCACTFSAPITIL